MIKAKMDYLSYDENAQCSLSITCEARIAEAGLPALARDEPALGVGRAGCVGAGDVGHLAEDAGEAGRTRADHPRGVCAAAPAVLARCRHRQARVLNICY